MSPMIEIGAHTVNHPQQLSMLSEDDQAEEINECKNCAGANHRGKR